MTGDDSFYMGPDLVELKPRNTLVFCVEEKPLKHVGHAFLWVAGLTPRHVDCPALRQDKSTRQSFRIRKADHSLAAYAHIAGLIRIRRDTPFAHRIDRPNSLGRGDDLAGPGQRYQLPTRALGYWLKLRRLQRGHPAQPVKTFCDKAAIAFRQFNFLGWTHA